MLAPFFIPLDPPVFPSPKQFSLGGQAMPGGAIQVTGCPTPREEHTCSLGGSRWAVPCRGRPLIHTLPCPMFPWRLCERGALRRFQAPHCQLQSFTSNSQATWLCSGDKQVN